jgi:hypothetical protein
MNTFIIFFLGYFVWILLTKQKYKFLNMIWNNFKSLIMEKNKILIFINLDYLKFRASWQRTSAFFIRLGLKRTPTKLMI